MRSMVAVMVTARGSQPGVVTSTDHAIGFRRGVDDKFSFVVTSLVLKKR
jgi:hypothetical protein